MASVGKSTLVALSLCMIQRAPLINQRINNKHRAGFSTAILNSYLHIYLYLFFFFTLISICISFDLLVTLRNALWLIWARFSRFFGMLRDSGLLRSPEEETPPDASFKIRSEITISLCRCVPFRRPLAIVEHLPIPSPLFIEDSRASL